MSAFDHDHQVRHVRSTEAEPVTRVEAIAYIGAGLGLRSNLVVAQFQVSVCVRPIYTFDIRLDPHVTWSLGPFII